VCSGGYTKERYNEEPKPPGQNSYRHIEIGETVTNPIMQYQVDDQHQHPHNKNGHIAFTVYTHTIDFGKNRGNEGIESE
jgi:hypothetical protein